MTALATLSSPAWYDQRMVSQKHSVVLGKWLQQRPGAVERAAITPVRLLPQTRNYAAAQINRLTEGWSTVSMSANSAIHRSLDAVRARSRQLSTDDEYVKKWLSLVETNVIGPEGFRFQARVFDGPGKPDTAANNAIESGWARFGMRGVCDVTGQQSMAGLCRMLIKATARDGEYLVQIVRGKDAGNEFGLALQVLDIDRLDTQLNRPAQGTTQAIRMGVEINAFGRPTHYHLKTAHPGDLYQATSGVRQSMHIRVAAEDIIHGYIADRPEQVRGMPWAHAAMLALNNLGGYREAAIIASRVGASKMGFYTTPPGTTPAMMANGTDANGDLVTDADPGTFETLPAGTGFTPFNPDYPSAMFGDFVKANLRGVSSGLLVSYHSLTSDLEGVSFSSIRSGTLEERDSWMMLQRWFAESFLDRVKAEYLRHGLLFGQIKPDNGAPLPLAKIDKFSAHTWQGRRWEWVNPLQDIEADIAAINNNLKSPQSVASKLGVDYEDLLDEIQAAQAMRKARSIADPLTAGQFAAAAGAAASAKTTTV